MHSLRESHLHDIQAQHVGVSSYSIMHAQHLSRISLINVKPGSPELGKVAERYSFPVHVNIPNVASTLFGSVQALS